jgi:hypothetical protein
MQPAKRLPADLPVVQFIPMAEFIAITVDDTAVRSLNTIEAVLFIRLAPFLSPIIKTHIGDIRCVFIVRLQKACGQGFHKTFPSLQIRQLGCYR